MPGGREFNGAAGSKFMKLGPFIGVTEEIMISDILSQIVVDLDHYLTDPTFDHVYIGDNRERLFRLRDEADNIRAVLDMPPNEIPPPEAVLSAEIDVTGTSGDQDQEVSQDTRSARQKWIAWMMSDESAEIPPIFSQKDLLERGWSKGQIEEVLGQPDSTSPNPHGTGFAPMKCWRQSRVLAVEDTPAFRPSRSKIRDQKVPAIED
jgi:hypothetical protein